MRRRLLWALLLFAPVLFLSSCKDDEDPVPAVVGTWVKVDYTLTTVPTGFTKYWTNYKIYPYTFWVESGYTLKINADGTYSRSYVREPYFDDIDDTGKWTLEGTEFTLKPDSPDDEDDVNDDPFAGLEFDVVGDIGDSRMTLSRVINLSLATDAALDAAGGDLGLVADADFKAASCTVQYKFNKLK